MRHSEWNGVLENIRRAMTRRGRADLGCCVVEGTRIHERALRAGRKIETALVSASFRAAPTERIGNLLAALEDRRCDLRVVPDEVVLDLTDGRCLGGIVGLARLAESPGIDALIAAGGPSPITFLVAMGVEEPGNVGALVRTGLAAGVAAFVGVGVSDAYHPKAVRTSMGSVFKSPVLHYRDAATLLSDLASVGVTSVGAVASEGQPLPSCSFGSPPIALVMGSESFGLSREEQEAMDLRVTIPMATEIDSFSVNAAAAVLLYEIRLRPRGEGG